jgi:hypothetical protein
MADWNTPDVNTNYATLLTALLARDVDALTMQVAAITNPPVGAFKYVRASNKFQEWDGAAYQDKVLAIAGGGTGAATAAAARTALGLGTMAVQDDNAVTITGGVLAGVGTGLTALNAANLSSGQVASARLGSGVADATKYLRGDLSWQVFPSFDIAYGADQSADFTPAVDKAYNLSGSHTVNLPTVVGNGGAIIILIMKTAGTWTIDPAGTETILGALTYTFNWGIYGALVLKADANNGKWDII